MATTNNITTTYVGKDSGAFISPVLNAGVTLGTPTVTRHNNVNYRSRITTTLDLVQSLKMQLVTLIQREQSTRMKFGWRLKN